VHPEHRGEGGVAGKRVGSAVFKGSAVPDRSSDVRGFCLFCHLMIIVVTSVFTAARVSVRSRVSDHTMWLVVR